MLLERVRAKLAAARMLTEDRIESTPAITVRRTARKVVRAPRRGGPSVTWLTEIEAALKSSPDGLSYPELRDIISNGPLAVRLAESDKGLYGGVGKLEVAGKLAKHNGKLFTPRALKDFLRRVDEGLIADVVPATGIVRPSPMADEIVAFIGKHPRGVVSGDIVNHLKRIPEFAGPVSRNHTSAYNVIKRLLERGQIRKQGTVYLSPEENEPPAGKPASGSETGVAAPVESRGDQRKLDLD